MEAMPRAAVALLLCTALEAAQIPTCAGAGLSVTGGRFGDAWSIGLAGPPGAAAILASDLAPGPVMTPFGTVCVGLTPSLVTQPLTLDPAGSFSVTGLLPLGALLPPGATLYVQAAMADPFFPGGVGLTNGFAV